MPAHSPLASTLSPLGKAQQIQETNLALRSICPERVELQGTGEGRSFTLNEQRALVDLCAGGVRELMELQKKVLEG